MLYLSTCAPPSVQLGTVVCDFVERGEEVLVIKLVETSRLTQSPPQRARLTTQLTADSKLRRLTVNKLNNGQVDQLFEIPLWGSIAAMASVELQVSRPTQFNRASLNHDKSGLLLDQVTDQQTDLFGFQNHSTSTLLVLTTSLELLALDYSPTYPFATTVSSTSLFDPHARVSDYQSIQVDPHNRLILVYAYTGLVRVIPLSAISATPHRRQTKSAKLTPDPTTLDLGRGFNIRIPLPEITSLALLARPADELPTFAVVHGNAQGKRLVSFFGVDLADRDVEQLESTLLEDVGSEVCFDVRGEGVVVCGEESVRFVPHEGSQAGDKGKARLGAVVKCRLPVGQIKAVTPCIGSPNQFILGDVFGKLLLLRLTTHRVTDKVAQLIVTDIGDANSPTALTFLSPTLLYLASRLGDSQLVRIPRAVLADPNHPSNQMDTDADDVEAEGTELELMASFPSLAPILDGCVVEGHGAGASQLVTCSGAYKGGSLRVVRQGVGIHELARLELDGVQKVWSLNGAADQGDGHLVLGFFGETKVLRFAGGQGNDDEADIEEVELGGFRTEEPTVWAGRVGGRAVQVTANGVYFDGGEWKAEGMAKITLAEGEGDRVVVALSGGIVVALDLSGLSVAQVGRTELDNELAVVSVSSLSGFQVVAVGLWTTQTVTLLSLPTLSPISSQVVPSTFLIRSILVTDFGASGAPVVLAGLGDGSLVSYSLDNDVRFVPTSEKKVVLGKRPVLLAQFEAGGQTSVFAASERPTIVTRPTGGRLVYSSANLENLVGVAPFDSGAFSGALALATASGIILGRLEAVQKVDIRAIPLDEDEPRKIAHDKDTSTYAVVCLRRDVDRQTGQLTHAGSVRFLDDGFEPVGVLKLQLNEEGQSVAVRRIDDHTQFVVGTAVVLPDEPEPTRGRLLLLTKEGEIEAEAELSGCPYAVAVLPGGEVAVAVNSQVIVFEVVSDRLSPIASWGGAFVALSLSVSDSSRNELLVGDAMRSVALLRFVSAPGRGSIRPAALEEVARDFRANYLTAAHAVTSGAVDEEGGQDFVGAETELNVFTVRKEVSATATTRQGHKAVSLEPGAAFHLGEMVSAFRPGSLARQLAGADDGSPLLAARLVFTTSAGSVGTLSELDPGRAALVTALERNLSAVLPRVGGLGQVAFRSWKDGDASFGGKQAEAARGVVDGEFVESMLEWVAQEGEWERVVKGEKEAEGLGVGRERVVELVEELARGH